MKVDFKSERTTIPRSCAGKERFIIRKFQTFQKSKTNDGYILVYIFSYLFLGYSNTGSKNQNPGVNGSKKTGNVFFESNTVVGG